MDAKFNIVLELIDDIGNFQTKESIDLLNAIIETAKMNIENTEDFCPELRRQEKSDKGLIKSLNTHYDMCVQYGDTKGQNHTMKLIKDLGAA